MEPSVTVTFDNLTPAQAANLFAAIKLDYDGPVAQPVALAAEAAPPEAAAKPKKAPKSKTQASEPEVHTIDDVRAALADVLASKGADSSRQLLANFKADRISKLKPEQYVDFIKEAKGLVA